MFRLVSGEVGSGPCERMAWYKANLTFPSDIEIELVKKAGPLEKRDRPPPGSISENKRLFESFDLFFDTGNARWSSGNRDESKLPFCRVGAWDESRIAKDGVPQTLEPVRTPPRVASQSEMCS